MTKTSSLLALGLLAGRALAQAPPSPPGSWVLQLKGQAYDQSGRLVWSRAQYAADADDDAREATRSTDPNGVRGVGSNDVAGVHGSISVRRRWLPEGGTPTTPAPNFRIHSYAHALAAFIDSASANDGLSAQSGDVATADDLRLIQPGASGDGDTTVSFSTTGEHADFFVGAAFDDRSATVGIAGVPQSYDRGAGDAPTTPPHRIFMGVDCGPADYTPYAPKLAIPRLSGADFEMAVNYGLGVGEFDTVRSSGGPADPPTASYTERKPVHTSITYVPSVTQLRIPDEPYSLSTTLVADTVSEILPSPTPLGRTGWDIESLTNVYDNPTFYSVTQDGIGSSSFDAGHSGKAESVKLTYGWNDGLKATATLNVTLHKPLEDGQRWGNPVPHVAVGDWEGVPLKDGSAPTYAASWPYLSGGDPTTYAIAGGSTTILTALTAVPDEISFLAAAAAIALSNGATGVEPQYRDFPRGEVTNDNLSWGPGGPLLNGALPDADNCTWTADTTPEYYVAFYMQDSWGPAGYLGQVPGEKHNPVPPHARQHVRYHFTYVEGSGTGGGGNPGGNS